MRRLALTLVAGASLVLPAAAGAGATHDATTCGYIHASVPYTAHGQAEKWRVYVTGHTSCVTATSVLNAVMHLHGKEHDNGTEVSSYITYSGWLCPFGQMGVQTCLLPTRLPEHGPIRAHALALSCTGPGQERCPREVPASEV